MRTPKFWKKNGLAVAALSPLGSAWGLAAKWKKSVARPFRAQAKVVCIGNLTAGGTGKTPVAMAIAEAFAVRGWRVAFLSRGHGGRMRKPMLVDPERHSARVVGDEPLLLARVAPTIVSPDRAEGARLAQQIDAEILVMDDGFQNFTLEKNLSFLVIDATTGFGNGRLIPAGPLRETVAEGFARADALILMGGGALELPSFGGPIMRAHLSPTRAEDLRGIWFLAFAGIGRPEKFFNMLREEGAVLAETRAFPDHHPYNTEEIASLHAAAEKLGAALVTTEKDYVRLSRRDRYQITPVPVTVRFDDPSILDMLLDQIAPRDTTP